MEKKVNLYFAYEIKFWPFSRTNHFTIANCSFEAVQLTKNPDPDKNFNSGYGIGFDVRPTFSLSNGSGFGKILSLLV